jgi:hypothetical protein
MDEGRFFSQQCLHPFYQKLPWMSTLSSGENAPKVRARVCDGLGFLGIELEEKQNAANAGVISADTSRVTVRVIRTDEEWMIAKAVCRVLGLTVGKENFHENEKD